MSGLILISQLFVLSILSYFVYLLSYSLIRGAPYAPIGKKRLTTMLDLLNMKKGNFIDIGSGDGRIVIAATVQQNVIANGIEINPLLVLFAWIRIKKRRLNNAHIICGDCYMHSYNKYDFISIWGTNHMVKNLEKKLYKELKPGAKIVSNHYKFQKWKPAKIVDDVYLYIR